MEFWVGVADGVDVGGLAVAVIVAVEVEVAVGVTLAPRVVVALDTATPVDGVALATGLGVAVFCVVATPDGAELATTTSGEGVALDAGVTDAADDVDAGVGVDEADTLDAAVTTAI